MKSIKLLSLTLVTTLLFSGLASAQSGGERVALLKANLEASKQTLHHYEWIETTTVSLHGDVKSTKEMQCYYGDDGSLQKVELSDDQAQARHPLLFRRIKEHKKEELTDYMKSAVALIKTYVPPSPSMIQAAKDNGNFSMQLLEPGRRARLIFTNYELQGDSYSVDISLVSNRPLSLKVSTWLNDPSDAVKLSVNMGQLNSGATYASDATLNAEAKGIIVTVTNSGYHRIN